MMNIGVGSILTKGLGGPACNLMIFGPFRLYIEPVIVPPVTPTVTPSPSPPPVSGGTGGGGGTFQPPDDVIHPTPTPSEEQFKLTFAVNFRGRTHKRTFVVDSFKKDKIIKRVGKINTLILKFKVAWGKVSKNRFKTKWKK